MTSPTATLIASFRRRASHGRGRHAVTLVGAVTGLLFMAVPLGPTTAGAVGHGSAADAHASAHTNLSVFCTALKPAKLTAAVGGTVKLAQSLVRDGILTCIFKAPSGFISIEYQVGLSNSTYAKLSTAKPAIAAQFGSGVKATVKADPAFGGHTYYWTAKIGGAPYSGLNYYKSGAGWFIEMPGVLQLAKLENLERIADKA